MQATNLYVLCPGGMYPGQTFLLAKVMSAFDQDDMQQQGNFYSLMMFVMAIGIDILYGILGWATNVISQVSDSHLSIRPAGLRMSSGIIGMQERHPDERFR